MKLAQILQNIKTDYRIIQNSQLVQDSVFEDIAIDSRLVKEISIFFAVPGKTQNGSKFIHSAIANGAKIVISNDFSNCQDSDLADIIAIESDHVFELLAECLNLFYPPLPNNIYAVTGTNGKTTIAEFGRQILQLLGKKSASIGTLGVISDGIDQSLLQQSVLTTPDIVSFYKNLSILKQHGVDDVFIEASSIGIEQQRILGLKIGVGAFSNFSQDHLDYHSSMDEYFRCKMLLFSDLLADGSVAVLNKDIDRYQEMTAICQQKNHQIFTYGFNNADFQICDITRQDLHQRIIFNYHQKKYIIDLDIIGEFQAFNILCALASILAKHQISGQALQDLLNKFTQIKSACGRMQKVATLDNNAQIFIDFAHSSDALANVLHLARNLTEKRVVVLFGCGGNRDAKKRPLMGKVACDLADLVIVTEDNPRCEDPAHIRKEVLAGCNERAIEIANRQTAIEQSIGMLEPGDILVLSGKGHEKYQVVGDQRLAFDEEKIVKNALKNVV